VPSEVQGDAYNYGLIAATSAISCPERCSFRARGSIRRRTACGGALALRGRLRRAERSAPAV